jgi:hypothetical protein
MVAELKSHFVIDGPALDEYRPVDPKNFNVTLRLMVGPRAQPSEESLDIVVCTPAALQDECTEHGFVFGRNRLIVSEYDPSLILDTLKRMVERCDGTSWPEVGSKLSRYGYWEFEDYRPAQ